MILHPKLIYLVGLLFHPSLSVALDYFPNFAPIYQPTDFSKALVPSAIEVPTTGFINKPPSIADEQSLFSLSNIAPASTINIQYPSPEVGSKVFPVSAFICDPSLPTAGDFTQSADLATLSQFLSYFCKRVSSSDILPKLFDIALTPEEADILYYNNILLFGKQFRLPDGLTRSLASSQAAAKAFYTITPDSYFRATSNSFERFLKHVGVLTVDNVSVLVDGLAGALEDALRSKGSLPTAKQSLDSLTEGSTRFLKSLNIPSWKLPLIISLFIEEISSNSS